jgi:hypothetical protein
LLNAIDHKILKLKDRHFRKTHPGKHHPRGKQNPDFKEHMHDKILKTITMGILPMLSFLSKNI